MKEYWFVEFATQTSQFSLSGRGSSIFLQLIQVKHCSDLSLPSHTQLISKSHCLKLHSSSRSWTSLRPMLPLLFMGPPSPTQLTVILLWLVCLLLSCFSKIYSLCEWSFQNLKFNHYLPLHKILLIPLAVNSWSLP